MASFLFYPLVYIFQKAFGDVTHHNTSSIVYWIKWFAIRVNFFWTYGKKKGRFDLYNFLDTSGDPFKLGTLVPKEEYDIDPPQPKERLNKKSDGVLTFATNSSGECLLVQICRHADGTAEVWLYLRTSDGRGYVLTEPLAVDHSNESVYYANGLKIECVIPMRSWRIAFNGLCRRLGDSNIEGVHVKFSFICNTQTNVVDFSCKHDNNFLAHQLATSKNIIPPSTETELLAELDVYSLGQYVLGTVQVNGGEEQEIFLWGFRDRFRDSETGSYRTCGRVIGFTKNGLYLNVTEKHWEKLHSRFTYGCMAFPTTQIRLIKDCSSLTSNSAPDCKSSFTISMDRFTLEVVMGDELDSFNLPFRHNGKMEEVCVKFRPFKIDGNDGHALFIGELRTATTEYEIPSVPDHILQFTRDTACSTSNYPYTLPFTEKQCQNVNAAGGKGSSLSILTFLSQDGSREFIVPRGLVVTSSAYEKFTQDQGVKSAIQELEDIACQRKDEALQDACQRTVQIVSDTALPEGILEAMRTSLHSIFGDELQQLKFAVRSSGLGEDSEEMSAAGQMETFLGVKGFDEIAKAVSKCWGSQFSHVACEYKRRYGQPLNSPMAVVIQEMVPSEIAGVMFTCDPVSSDPRRIVITANYGLGESVVSAAAEPDTVTLNRTIDDILSVSTVQVGAKKMRIIMQEDGGTKEEEIGDSQAQASCLSEDRALHLGNIGLKVQNAFSGPRDIEWAFANERLYLLQSRPVTSIYTETDFEIIREFDSGVSSEMGCLSKANIGEVMKGASSPLAISCVFPMFMLHQRRISVELSCDSSLNPYSTVFGFPSHHHMFFTVVNEIFDTTGDDLLSKGFSIGLSGRQVNDEEVLQLSANIKKYKCTTGDPMKISLLLKELYYCESNLDYQIKRYETVTIPVFDLKSSDEIFKVIAGSWDEMVRPLICHSDCINYSSICNVLVLAILSRTRGDWDTLVFSDFARLVSTCNNLVSVGVPSDLQNISLSITNEGKANQFKEMTDEDALEWLKTNQSESGIKFRQFLQDHGHRCVNEFDVHNKPWGDNPLPVVQTLKSMSGVVQAYAKEELSIPEAIDKLEIKLGFVKRTLMKFILEKCRQGVALRERAKSLLVKSVNLSRKAYWHLAKKLVHEGRIPDEDIMFFLTLEEIRQLIETRSPKLLAKAARRRRLHDYLDSLRFPEIVKGVPRPIKQQTNISQGDGRKIMKGTPVSHGVVVGTARVVNELKEAVNIQRGDILITYCTDIGWSPYFPLLGGVVTELGGLISHGAVVAREYGLPCVVGLHGATGVFKSGEKVQLDGTKGVLQTVD